MSTPIRPNVLNMTPYVPGRPIDEVKQELGLDRVIKLASNENPFGPSPKAVEALKQAVGDLHLYPDGATAALKKALSAKFDIGEESLVLGNGSDELIHLLGLVFLGHPSDEVIVGEPSFIRYDASAELAACHLVRVPLDRDLAYDLKAFSDAVTDHTRLVFLANPNNPTGGIVGRTDLAHFLKDLPRAVTLVLDEAYYEFAADDPEYPSSLEFIREGYNVIGLRTFSKAYGLAGIRLGYGFASPRVADAFNRAREPFNVNSLAQIAGIAALSDDEHVRTTVQMNSEERRRMAEQLTGHGARVFPSWGNFLFADFGRPSKPIYEALLAQGVIVRPGSAFGKPSFLRISIGTPEENTAFVTALDRAVTAVV